MAKSDYDKPYEPHPATQLDWKAALAAEYSAHHMGRISKALERIADALEKQKPSSIDGREI